MVVFCPIIGTGKKIAVTTANVDTALDTTGNPNCIKVETYTDYNGGTNLPAFIRLGAAGGTAVVSTDMAILAGHPYYIAYSPSSMPNLQAISTSSGASIYVTMGHVANA